MTQPTPITVANGDGIGPEIMEATLRISFLCAICGYQTPGYGITSAGYNIIKTENLCTLNGEPVFSAGQGA